MRRISASVLGAALLAAIPASAQAVPSIPVGLQARTVASGLQAPTSVAFAPDGRIFVAEKQGTVKVVLPGEAPRARLLLDISGHVATHVDRGLLGIAADSSFASNGYLYLLYTYDPDPLRTSAPKVNRLTRIKVGAGATVASGETVLLGTSSLAACPTPGPTVDCLPSDGFSHSIGSVRSAPDGSLWVGIGDGVTPGSMSSTIMRTFDPNVMSGAILHVDRNGRGLTGHPFCPTVTDLSRSCTKVHAKGFRNPFRFSVMLDGRVAVGDVGYESWEELDIPVGGRLYGWPCREGRHPTPGYSDTTACRAFTLASFSDPVFEYAHGPGGGSIMAGPQLGSSWPVAMRGKLVLGDYALGTLSLFDPANPAAGASPLLSGLDSVVDVTSTPGGGVALVEAGFTASGLEPGRVWVLEPTSAQRPWPRPSASASGLVASFDSRVADADTPDSGLSWSWDFGDGTLSTDAKPVHTYAAPGVYIVRVAVSDGTSTGTDALAVSVGQSLPTVTIAAPAGSPSAIGGRSIDLRGSASLDGSAMRASSLMWTVILHHGVHQHYLTGFSGAAGSFDVPTDHDLDSWYDVRLKAITNEGRTGSARIRIDPKGRTLTAVSSPTGAALSFGGKALTGARLTAVGYKATLSAPSSFTKSGIRYRFSRWSDGSRSTARSFQMPDRATMIKAYFARG